MSTDRWDQIFDQIHNNIPADEIYSSMRRGSQIRRQEMGNETELQFIKNTKKYLSDIVTGLRQTEPDEDLDGADFYISLKTGVNLPVQVKSSDDAVVKFRQDPRYLNAFKKNIIVINSASYVPKNDFIKHFLSELKRIERLDLTE